MDTKLLIIFIVLNIFNVIIQTVKSIATVKCGKTIAAIINAVAYGLYTIVTVYMLCELDLWLKAVVVAVANLIGVYVVKLLEEKARKDKLWKVEATVIPQYVGKVQEDLTEMNISHNCFKTSGEHRIFNIFCSTQKESAIVKEILNKYNAKYFVSETKNL